MTWLCQQEGLDLNAPVKHGALTNERFGRLELHSHITDEPCSTGSILFYLIGEGCSEPFAKFLRGVTRKLARQPHSETLAANIAILQKNGATAVPPAAPSMAQRFVGYLKNSNGALSLEQLIADGLSFNVPFDDGRYPLDLAEHHGQNWNNKTNKINELPKAGASAEQSLSLPNFQQRLQRYLFDANYRIESSRDINGQRSTGFVAEDHIDTVISILTAMATRGLALATPQKL